MSAEDTATQLGRRRCPVCWTWFTPNSPSNPHPRRYCCGACRIEDSRRRRERQQTQLLLDANSTPSAPPDTSKPNTARHPSPTAYPTKGDTHEPLLTHYPGRSPE